MNSSLNVENLEAIKITEDNESADKIKQKSLEMHLSSRPPQALHFEKLGNYISEIFCLVFFLVSSNFELYIYNYSLLIHSCSLLIYISTTDFSLLHTFFQYVYMHASHVWHLICNSVPEFIYGLNRRGNRSLTAEHCQRFHHCPNKTRNVPWRKNLTSQTYLEGNQPAYSVSDDTWHRSLGTPPPLAGNAVHFCTA